MGIKSTTTLKRSDALERYLYLLEELYGFRGPSNEELANLLETLEDVKAARDGTTNYDNFWVVEDHEYKGPRDY